jgi:uncharacterized protein DUF5985
MIASAVYVLSFLTSGFCATLLMREYRRTGSRLLLWSSLSFMFWALNHAMVFADLVMFPDLDLSLVRASLALIAVSLLLYGLIWDAT